MARKVSRAKPFQLHESLTRVEAALMVDVFSTAFSAGTSQVTFLARCPVSTLRMLLKVDSAAQKRVYRDLTAGVSVVDLHTNNVFNTVYTVTLPQGKR